MVLALWMFGEKEKMRSRLEVGLLADLLAMELTTMRKRMLSGILKGIFAATFFSLLVSCTAGSGPSVQLADGSSLKLERAETLRVNITSEPPTLDWNKATDTTSSHIINNLMEGLVGYDIYDKELRLIPLLATEWTPSEKALVWNFKIRADVRWSDGVAFEAQQVLDSWRRLLAKETASEYAYFLFAIKNARAFNEGKLPWEQVGVRVVKPASGPTEIRIELEKPMGYFPHLLVHASTYPIRLDLISKYGEKWTEAGNMVGLGPFVLKAWRHDKEILLERNNGYFGAKSALRFVHAQMIQEQATALNLFEAGKLDAVDGIPSTELKNARKKKEFRSIGVLQSYYYGLNTQKPPLNDPLVRRAIAQAIDRQKVVQVLAGGQIPMTGWVPSGMFGYATDVGLEFNLERARADLEKAGYNDKHPLPKIEIQFNISEDHQRIAELVQSQLKENLGINVELKSQEWKTFLSSLKTDPPMLFRFGWLADYPDPDNFMNLMTSYSDNNHTRWSDKRYDKLIEQAATETSAEVRRDLYRKAGKIMLEEAVPVIPLFSSTAQLFVAERVERFPLNALRRFEYKAVSFKN